MKMADPGLGNGLFTWNNKRGGEALVASKLDRAMILEELMLINKEITTKILPFGGVRSLADLIGNQGYGFSQE